MNDTSNSISSSTSSNTSTNNRIYHISDKIIKKILTLSSRAVLNLINGLFHTDYPLDSMVTYNWTEHHDDDLNRTIADTILTINGIHSYHLEAQMYRDEEIEFRVFDYGYRHALNSRNGLDVLTFPEPQIIYLYSHERIPDYKTILLDFGSQGTFEYRVPAFKLLEHRLEELDRRKMIILIPFMVLKLRSSIQKERTPQTMEALRKLILDDIMNLIRKNHEEGNITSADASRLRNLIHQLYNHLYSHYDEFIEGGLNDMMEDGLILEYDIIEAKMKKELKEAEAKAETKAQRDTIRKLYSKLQDAAKVADLLDLPVDTVEESLN